MQLSKMHGTGKVNIRNLLHRSTTQNMDWIGIDRQTERDKDPQNV